MKNIYLLPTDKPSRLYSNNGKLHLDSILQNSGGHTINQHIYITADLEIKEGEWFITTGGYLHRCHTKNSKTIYYVTNSGGIAIGAEYCKKVILTTDEDLIVSGVQAIDNTFAEWFVKNSSCEIATLEKEHDDTVPYPKMRFIKPYKIIIPQEEPKQETLEEAADIEKIAMDKLKSKWEHLYTFGYPKRPFPTNYENDFNNIKIGLYEGAKIGLYEGAKLKEERSYSEEDMLAFLDWSKSTNKEKSEYELKCLLNGKNIDSKKLFIMWFENNKKK
jgi:hypothetical protein